MKTLKFTILLLCMLIINSCTKKNEDESTQKIIPEVTKQESNEESKENPEHIIVDIYPFYQHSLYLNFQDASGNDLLEGSEFIWDSEFGMRDPVKPEFYTLDIIFEDGIPNPWKPEPKPYVIYDVNYPRLYLAKTITPLESLEKSLWFETQSYKFTGFAEALLYGWDIEYCDFAEKIIFRLTCPYIFGDNEAHDIVTWWELHEYYTECYRVEYGGKEFPVEESVATIILDR